MAENKILGLSPNPEGEIGISQFNKIIEKLKEKGVIINIPLQKSIYYEELKSHDFYNHLNLEYQIEEIYNIIVSFWKEKIVNVSFLTNPKGSEFLVSTIDLYFHNKILEVIENTNEIIFKFKNDPLKVIGHLIGKNGIRIKELSKLVRKKVVIKQ
jgi:hypothetical protein